MPRPIVALRSRSRVTTGVGDVTGERAGRKCADHTCLPRRKDDPRRVARSPPNLRSWWPDAGDGLGPVAPSIRPL